jgi:hypothetical protein
MPTSPAGGAPNVRLGPALTVTAADAAEAGPVPAALTAATLNV